MIGRATTKDRGVAGTKPMKLRCFVWGRGSGTTTAAETAVIAMTVVLERRRERGGDSEQRQMGEGQEAMQPEA